MFIREEVCLPVVRQSQFSSSKSLNQQVLVRSPQKEKQQRWKKEAVERNRSNSGTFKQFQTHGSAESEKQKVKLKQM